MSLSAFGIEHGDFSKGLPSAVKGGGGGYYGSLMRLKNHSGRNGARNPILRDMTTRSGRHIKAGMEQEQVSRRVSNPARSRSTRAALLNADSASRRAGNKSGKYSALDRHYRGRVNDMKELP